MIAFPKFRINLKPLLPRGLEVDSKKVLKMAQREILKALRVEIQSQAFSPRAKRALKKGMRTRIGANSIQVIATHPAFYPLLEGQRSQQMRWLTKAKRPIPIVLDSGELIFRNATPYSMSRGRWYHPGRQPSTVIARAKKVARAVVKRRLGKELGRQFRRSL